MIPDMNNPARHHFLDTIYHLRNEESLLLFSRIAVIEAEEALLVTDFLELEYRNECLDYPATPPAFNAAAALWGAKTIYTAAQLLLYREHTNTQLPVLLPAYNGTQTPDAILSADLCLRFLPAVLQQAENIDPDDVIISLLQACLQQWHYSGISCYAAEQLPDMAVVLDNATLRQLYADRVIACKQAALAKLPALAPVVKASMGNYANYFWKELL
ncbi:hypothetical protein HNQ91_001671 [Filimonas zeae]|uniref:MoxR-vWA-beta-propeller ternary system domain-containing protein n=1 Tax=Filimonas zeae TaxID=1737353 RepID=A0A917IZ55_9BACT|nr:hypothetical protein [Filimonas zeae]MDR6338620.1 hypothetical protein [Filimonas zeae]GGH67365.1 hypothetical protein GCM10011379_22560 [Filimonas zeae]